MIIEPNLGSTMTTATFLKRIEEGKANNFTYVIDGREGSVSVWKYKHGLMRPGRSVL
jgi:hypothetical protein